MTSQRATCRSRCERDRPDSSSCQTMSDFIMQPWQLFLAILAGWVNRKQQKAVEYLRAENRVLRVQFGGGRILLNDDQRRRLAVKGRSLGRKLLGEVATLFTPNTILRWHRQLVAQKWDTSNKLRAVRAYARSSSIMS